MIDLTADMKMLKKKLNDEANITKQKLASFILFNLTRDTPVDTSRAISNWQIGLRSPNATVRNAHSVGDRGSTFSFSSNTTYLVGNAIISSAKVGETVFISNNLDYISDLDKGVSPQANEGFILDSVDNAVSQIMRGFKK